MVNALLRYMHARHCLDFGLACIYGHVLNRKTTFDMYVPNSELFASMLHVETLTNSSVLITFPEIGR